MTRRLERLVEEIRIEVAKIIAADLKDPRIGFVTVTRAELTSDLAHARIFVGILGSDAQRSKTLAGLKQASGFIRRELGRRLRIRQTPDVQFRYDEGLDAADRVAQLLDEVRPTESPEPPDEENDDR